MNNRPNPKSFKRDSISPTKILGETVKILKVLPDEYEGTPQLRCVTEIPSGGKEYDLYVSNSYVREFLESCDKGKHFPAEFIFYKANPNQRHYEIMWADNPQQDEIPF